MTQVDSQPLVSIGLPVYNGERYLEAAVKSLLGQSHRNIELVVCDNASQDATARICGEFARNDSRVRYERLPENIGAVPNHNRVLEKSHGEYFMWSSHDDVWHSSYVEKCLNALRSAPSASAAYSATGLIDEQGAWLKEMPNSGDLGIDGAQHRFVQLLDLYSMIDPVYGVVRMSSLRAVGFMPMHPAADRVVFAGLALRGPIIRVPEALYFRRQHAGRSVRVYPKLRDRYAWVKPGSGGRKARPHVEYLRLMAAAVWRCGLSFREKSKCFEQLARWAVRSREDLVADFRA